jgi:hypothetical protein
MFRRSFWSSVSLIAAVLSPIAVLADIEAPAGSSGFGAHTLLLPNGNLAVSAPGTPGIGGEPGAGAVYLYSRDGELISVLRGAKAGDGIGSRGFTTALGGNGFFVRSSSWRSGSSSSAGAVTWVDGELGLSGVVGPENSIVGSSPGDAVGEIAPTPLGDGRFAVHAPDWDNGAATDAGAV